MRKLFTLTTCLFLTSTLLTAHAATYTASGTGNWSSSSTWGGAGVPTTNDVAIIPAGITVTVNVAAGTLDGFSAFDFYNPSRIEVFGTLDVVGSASATSGVLFENPLKLEVYSGGIIKDDDIQGAFNLVETSTITVYGGGTFYLFPIGGSAPFSTLIFDQTSDPVGSGPGTFYALGSDPPFNGNNPTISGPFTATVPSGSPGVDASLVQSTDPSSVSNAATSIASTSATLNATVGSGQLATNTIQFQYSTNATLSSGVTTVAATPSTLAAAPGTSSVTATPTGLASSTKYYFRINATNSLGTTQGNILSFTTLAPLPVRFVSFSALRAANDVDLSWTVGVNQQAKTYEVEHSTDGITFSGIGQVANNPDQTSYSFVHANAGSGTHYYRILETDLDGESIYSTIVSATIAEAGFSVVVLNNPPAPETDAQVQINAANAGTAFIEVWSVAGTRLSLQQRSVGKGATIVDLPMSQLPAGAYAVKIILNDHTQVTQIIKR